MKNSKKIEEKMAKQRLLFTKQSMSRAFKRSTQKMKRRAKKRKASVISDPANTSKFRPFGDPRALGDIAKTSLILVHQEVFNPRYNLCAPRIPPLAVTDDNKRKLKEFGSVIVLGDPSAPHLILVHCEVRHGSSMELPRYVNDDEKKRNFALIFLLIGKNEHMTMCFPVAEESWLLYDNDPKKTSFQPFEVNILKDYIICLAGYVNVTQALEYKLASVISDPPNTSEFRPFGDLRALGDMADPSLILVHQDVFNPRYNLCAPRIPPLAVTDDNKRIFQLQFMLLGKEDQMTICFRYPENQRKLYDTDQAKPFHHFSIDTLKNVDIYLAGYVNMTQAQEYKHGAVTSLRCNNGKKMWIFLVPNLKMEQFYERLRQQIDYLSIYIKDDGCADPNQFINTCVLDSFLAACHIAYIGYPNIADLLNGNDFFRHIIFLLQQKRFYEARRSCVDELGLGKVNLFGPVKEYFPLIRKLVWPKNPPNDSEITKNFALIFLLIGKNEHMTMCFPVAEESWLQYDNDPKKTSFQPLDVNILKDYIICLAGYVNVTQALEYKLGVAETGKEARLSNVHDEPFQQVYPQKSVLDVDMEDLSFTNPISIPETGVGTRPFDQNQQDILPEINNQEMAVEDVEMLSCSSCDSD